MLTRSTADHLREFDAPTVQRASGSSAILRSSQYQKLEVTPACHVSIPLQWRYWRTKGDVPGPKTRKPK